MIALRSVALVVVAVLLCVPCGQAQSLVERARLRGFARPSAAVDAEGSVYVADAGGNRVVKFGPRGDSIAAVSGSGWGDTQFDGPSGIAVRGIDVFVTDRGNHRVQRFDRMLSFVASLSTHESPRPETRFGYPRGVAISPQGDLYIIDGEGMRIVVVTPFNIVLRSFGSIDAGSLSLSDPQSVCAEADGIIDVVDRGTVKRFDSFGTPRGVLPGIRAVACAADGDRMYVLTDSALMRFTTGGQPASITLPPGAWRGAAASGETIVLWDDAAVSICEVRQ